MKRALEILALALLVAGIEMATGAVSHAIGRLARVYHELTVEGESTVALPRFVAGVGMMGLGGVLVGLDLWARATSRLVRSGKVCPDCGGQTERVRRRASHRLLGWILGKRITRRTCKTCGWSGLAS